ncbi:FlgB family protein [Gemmobacter caeruleus]|uniref:FlgB family protein n=1 Tax=Gemmobacter caeruleus TaxID=2595004 RepID=UPI0011EC7FAF|nr:FlgB family protein [Gemmobacter caeruleus]
MFEKLEIVRMAQSLAVHAGARQAQIARNIANADTPGFKAQDLAPFAESYGAAPSAMRATRPGHFAADGSTPLAEERLLATASSPDGNSVSLEQEMVRAVEVRQQHEMALAIYRNSSSILRSSLGRR